MNADNSTQTTEIETETQEPKGGRKPAAGTLARNSLYGIDPTRITRRAGWNPRFDFGEITELAKSIKSNGMLNPIRVKRLTPPTPDADFELIDGDRRLTAVLRLIKDGTEFRLGIPAVIVDKKQEDVDSLIQMFEANTGKAFLPLEEAAAFKRMRDAGLTIKEIAKRVSRGTVMVTEMLALIEADDSVKDAVASGAIGKTQAKEIASKAKGDNAKQAELVKVATEAAGKDKAKALRSAIGKARQEKAAKKGKVLKIRALSDAELSQIGGDLAIRMADKMRDAGMDLDTDLRAWAAKDDGLALAFTLGALEALKAAAGVKIDLDI